MVATAVHGSKRGVNVGLLGRFDTAVTVKDTGASRVGAIVSVDFFAAVSRDDTAGRPQTGLEAGDNGLG